MKIYIKNMVCQGTKLFVLHELERLGLKYNKFELGEIDFKEDLSLAEIKELDRSLHKYGLVVTFRNTNLVFKIRCVINDLVESNLPYGTSFSNYISRSVGYNYAFLNKYFIIETGLPIEEYFIEKKSEKERLNEETWSDVFNQQEKSA
jgi:hypothetical protein